IGKNIPENIDIIIPDSLPEETFESIISRRKETKEDIISIINHIIDNYLTPDSLHDNTYDREEDNKAVNNNTKFYTYLTMARALFYNTKEHFNNRIYTFPFSMYRFIKYFTLENKKLPLNKFVTELNFKLFNNVKVGIVRSYFKEYMAIAVQTLSKRSYYDKLSHLRRVQFPINTESENNEVRMSYEYGYFCPFETPESKDVGLVKYFGLSVLVAPDFSIDKNILNSLVHPNINYSSSEKEYPVLLNSRFIGFISVDLVEYTYKELKLTYPFISCLFDEVAYYLFTDEGRIVRPIKSSILPRMMKIFLSERVRYKNLLKEATGADYIIYDKRQYALKIQANSIYGCLGSSSLKYLRFLPGAECTTGMGRNYLNKTIDLIQNNTQFKVIYGDTDSCLIEYKRNIDDKFMDKSNNTDNSIYNISKHLDKNVSDMDKSTIKKPDIDLSKFIEDSKSVAEYVTSQLPEGMHLKYENTFTRMLIISKKKYSGLLANKSELYIKGIDIIKKNTCIFIRDYYKIFLYMILYNYPLNVIRKKVLEMKNEILSGKVPLEKLVMKLSIGPKYVNKSYYVLLFVNNHKRYNLNYKVGENRLYYY
ncbi:hypothetical protein PIROE2DRAFT_65452, partial [Piromyces sp. E2]